MPRSYPLDRHPGWNPDSVAFHADDGRLYKGKAEHGRPFGQPCDAGDRIGCGIKFEQVTDDFALQHVVPVFFTRNGVEVGDMNHKPPSKSPEK